MLSFINQSLVEETSVIEKRCYSIDFDPKNRILRFLLNGRINDEMMRDFYEGRREPAHRTQPTARVLDTSTVISSKSPPN